MLIELVIEMLGDLVVLRRVRAAKVIERKAKPVSEILLEDVHLRAILVNRETGLMCCQLSRRAMFVGRANEQDFVPARPLEARVGIRW